MAKWSTGSSPGIEERTGTWEEALNKSSCTTQRPALYDSQRPVMHDSTTRPTRINDPSCTTIDKSTPRQLLNKPLPHQLLNKSPLSQLLNKPPPHHLKRKATDSLFLLAIVITLDSIKVFAESVSDVFQIRLYRNIFTDRRAMARFPY
ncbi:hypothetical protein DPMN_125062 [Dreissena polymorpha]|uniref:Uncharacterized protein n=1 Tax=Dreissena polymorpha TaxID=45954 RepID=A0A9D4JWT3_DREPO|nr:hypothetical protein DPMN_125062 [Dreissena polymorpha]